MRCSECYYRFTSIDKLKLIAPAVFAPSNDNIYVKCSNELNSTKGKITIYCFISISFHFSFFFQIFIFAAH